MQELSQVIRSPDMSEADQLTKLRSLLAPHCCKRPGREVGRTHTVQREVSEEGHEGGGVGSSHQGGGREGGWPHMQGGVRGGGGAAHNTRGRQGVLG